MFFKKEVKSSVSQDLEIEYLAAKAKIQELEFEKKKLEQVLDLEKQKVYSELMLAKKEFEQEKILWTKTKEVEMSNMKGQLLVKHEQDISKIRHEAEKKVLEETERINKEFYGKMTATLEEIHSKGNASTKFMQDMALKMMDRHPSHTLIGNNPKEE